MSLEDKKHILEYWLKLEFFQPFSCPKIEANYRKYDQLKDILPWILSNNIADPDSDFELINKYDFYFCIFDKSEVMRITRDKLGMNEGCDFDWDENPRSEGYTCYAKVSVAQNGSFILDSFSASSLPWALGKLIHDEYNYNLNSEKFKHALKNLSNDISQLMMEYPYIEEDVILKLINICTEWAGFDPGGYFIQFPIYVEKTSFEQKKKNKKDICDETHLGKTKDHLENEDLPIFNSFYIKDLEKVIKNPSKSVLKYLSYHSHPHDHITHNDLNSEKGNKKLHELLNTSQLLKSRWPQNLNYHLNMMQLLAIHAIFDELNDKGIFSINGPPGTGKSTLLREIIAENITRRAFVLATYKDPKEAFLEEKLPIKSSGNRRISILKPELCGFEMLICTTSNNAAENISKELPRKSSISGSITYLQKVANRIAAKKDINKQFIFSKKEESWGLISVHLGKQSNCDKFIERVFVPSSKDLNSDKPVMFESIWDWRNSYSGLSFAQAKEEFICQSERVDLLLKEIKIYDENKKALDRVDFDEVEIRLETLKKQRYHLQKELDLKKQSLISSQKIVEILVNKLKNHNKLKICFLFYISYFLKNVFSTFSAIYHNYENKKLVLKNLEMQLEKEKSRELNFEKEIEEVNIDKNELFAEIGKLEDQLKNVLDLRQKIYEFEEKWGELDWLKEKANFQDEESHLMSFYQSEPINQEKTLLFQKALQLHEAWLAEVLKKKSNDFGRGVSLFGGNVSLLESLLKKKENFDRKTIKHLWQSLFMIVPVISSTFASVGNLFNGLESESLGWLFIDEAGQVEPQAAIGAIWRSKRVVVIGDPNQLKPVYTVPFPLVQRLGMKYFDVVCNNEKFIHFCPAKSSVQELADQVNSIGIYQPIKGVEKWIACPLRIHRRCQDPMFYVSNQISYDGRMIQAVNSSKDLYDESCWYNIKGSAQEGQYVKQQGDFIVEKIKEMSLKYNNLNSVFIITPFKAIERALKGVLKLNKDCFFSTKININTWINENVGTIHTFQGKEADIVFLVLGSDLSTGGRKSASWAAKEPNLLNVAVTRAKKNIYVVGDADLWGRIEFFEVLYSKLIENKERVFVEC